MVDNTNIYLSSLDSYKKFQVWVWTRVLDYLYLFPWFEVTNLIELNFSLLRSFLERPIFFCTFCNFIHLSHCQIINSYQSIQSFISIFRFLQMIMRCKLLMKFPWNQFQQKSKIVTNSMTPISQGLKQNLGPKDRKFCIMFWSSFHI